MNAVTEGYLAASANLLDLETRKERVTPSIMTCGGGLFWFEAPDEYHYHPTVLAKALSKICRYGGHCSEFYSVAQHSVHVSMLVPPEMALHALLHDAAEAFLGDIPTPLKNLLPQYKELEKRVEAAIFRQFKLPATLPPEIKWADLVALQAEKVMLMPQDQWAVLDGVPVTRMPCGPLAPEAAEHRFLRRFVEIMDQGGAL